MILLVSQKSYHRNITRSAKHLSYDHLTSPWAAGPGLRGGGRPTAAVRGAVAARPRGVRWVAIRVWSPGGGHAQGDFVARPVVASNMLAVQAQRCPSGAPASRKQALVGRGPVARSSAHGVGTRPAARCFWLGYSGPWQRRPQPGCSTRGSASAAPTSAVVPRRAAAVLWLSQRRLSFGYLRAHLVLVTEGATTVTRVRAVLVSSWSVRQCVR